MDDRKRLICLALAEGDKDVQNVAHYLMQRLSPAPRDLEELLTQMSPEDTAELAGLVEDEVSRQKTLTAIEQSRITRELQKACAQLGSLKAEEAF